MHGVVGGGEGEVEEEIRVARVDDGLVADGVPLVSGDHLDVSPVVSHGLDQVLVVGRLGFLEPGVENGSSQRLELWGLLGRLFHVV